MADSSDALADGKKLARIYGHRFSEGELAEKRMLWSTLCNRFFQRLVPTSATVLDLGAGSCEFINAIRAERRIAVDLNPDTGKHADAGVQVVATRSSDLSVLPDCSVDVVFSSNFFEHLPSKNDLLETLAECHRVLLPGGSIIVVMPNLRYLPGRYWDYLDHQIPLTHVSLVEALELSGFSPERVVPRFLPYTVKDARFAIRPWMIGAYLRLPAVWPLLGRQMLVVARALMPEAE